MSEKKKDRNRKLIKYGFVGVIIAAIVAALFMLVKPLKDWISKIGKSLSNLNPFKSIPSLEEVGKGAQQLGAQSLDIAGKGAQNVGEWFTSGTKQLGKIAESKQFAEIFKPVTTLLTVKPPTASSPRPTYAAGLKSLPKLNKKDQKKVDKAVKDFQKLFGGKR